MSTKNEHAVALGRKGGYRRADALSPERRKAIAKDAAAERWAKDRARKALAKESQNPG